MTMPATGADIQRSPLLDARSKLGAWCGIVLIALWVPMLIVIPLFPDLDSQVEVAAFWREHGNLTLAIMASVVAGYRALAVFLAEIAVRAARSGAQIVLGWAAFAAGLMFTTGLAVALGLAASAGRLAEHGADPATAYGLHAAAFILAAPFTGAGTGFFLLLTALVQRGSLGPRWLRWPAIAGVAGNMGAIGGLYTLTGPGNSGNGILGGILLPLGTFLVWTLCASLAWLRTDDARGVRA
jgi:hypothetical protein